MIIELDLHVWSIQDHSPLNMIPNKRVQRTPAAPMTRNVGQEKKGHAMSMRTNLTVAAATIGLALAAGCATTRKETDVNKLDGLSWKPRAASHIGALEGCAEHLGVDSSPAWIYGGTGHAFLMLAGADMCPSGPHEWNYLDTIPRLAKNLGFDVEVLAALSDKPEFKTKQQDFRRRIMKAIDAGQPCYGWHFEFMVINGYDEKNYLISGPEKSRVPAQQAMPWEDFGPIGFVEVLIVRKGNAAPPEKTVRDALSFAVQHADNHGFKAYDNWIAGLESGKDISDDGVGYHAAIWAECRSFAVDFLSEAKRRLPSDKAAQLKEAILHYSKVRDSLKQVSDIFPPCLSAAAPETMDEATVAKLKAYAKDQDRRNKAAALVRQARDAEREAVASLKGILKQL
jgi:hypothetical protein